MTDYLRGEQETLNSPLVITLHTHTHGEWKKMDLKSVMVEIIVFDLDPENWLSGTTTNCVIIINWYQQQQLY